MAPHSPSGCSTLKPGACSVPSLASLVPAQNCLHLGRYLRDPVCLPSTPGKPPLAPFGARPWKTLLKGKWMDQNGGLCWCTIQVLQLAPKDWKACRSSATATGLPVTPEASSGAASSGAGTDGRDSEERMCVGTSACKHHRCASHIPPRSHTQMRQDILPHAGQQLTHSVSRTP